MKKKICIITAITAFCCLFSIQTFASDRNGISFFAASDRHSNNGNLIKILEVINGQHYGEISLSVLIGDTFSGENNGENPPEKPEGEEDNPNGDNPPPEKPSEDGENPPEKPEGEENNPDGDNPPPEKPSEETEKAEETFDLSEVTAVIQSTVNGDVKCVYTYGAHDGEETDEYFTGAVDLEYAYIYGITFGEMTDKNRANEASKAFSEWIETVPYNKPVIIVSHVPLHKRRNDNAGGSIWLSAINKAATTHSILFLWAHNHSNEEQRDIDVYFVERGDRITAEGNRKSTVIQFTYANAGYLNFGHGSVITAYDDGTLTLDRYGLDGLECSYTIDSVYDREYIEYNPETDDGDLALWSVMLIFSGVCILALSKKHE